MRPETSGEREGIVGVQAGEKRIAKSWTPVGMFPRSAPDDKPFRRPDRLGETALLSKAAALEVEWTSERWWGGTGRRLRYTVGGGCAINVGP